MDGHEIAARTVGQDRDGDRMYEHKTGGSLGMYKQEIIFFDRLGFGWVVDKNVIQMIHESRAGKEVIIDKTLADLLGRH